MLVASVLIPNPKAAINAPTMVMVRQPYLFTRELTIGPAGFDINVLNQSKRSRRIEDIVIYTHRILM